MSELDKRIRTRNRIAREYGKRAAWHYETLYLRTSDIKMLRQQEDKIMREGNGIT